MTELEIGLLILAGILIIATTIFSLLFLAERKKLVFQNNANKNTILQLEQSRDLLESCRAESQQIRERFMALSSDHRNLKERFEEQRVLRDKDEERFEILANRVLERKSIKFDQQHRTGLKEILEPLKEKINHFELRIEHSTKESIERHTSLREQIRTLTELNERMSLEASNLTNALKSDTKKQGNWGELILESILDKSGLEKGREYHIQKSLRNDEGKRYQPDVIIDLPDEKKLIIDSKVSLVAYERFINAEEDEAGTLALKAHVTSVRRHIDALSAKRYHELYQINSPDFVLMFIPIDTAFSCALQGDDSLYQYAFDMNIVIVTPSTLLATLKTVETMWRNEKQNRYALDIAVEAGKMYDKFSGFVEDLEKLGRQLDTVRGTYEDSMKKMTTGTGNLIRRAEKLRKLGAKVSKNLPESMVRSQQ